jgi:hypothetical protein
MMPLPLHALEQMSDVNGIKTARWLSIYVGLRLPLALLVAGVGMLVQLPAAVSVSCGFFLAAWAPQSDTAVLGMCILTSPIITFRAIVNLRMKLAAGQSPEKLSKASTVVNQGRLLGRIFRSLAVGTLSDFFGFRGVCGVAGMLASMISILSVPRGPGASTESVIERPSEGSKARQDSFHTVFYSTPWWVWALAASFAMTEFTCNAFGVAYAVAASRDVGMSKSYCGAVSSFGLILALSAEAVGTKIPARFSMRSPLNVLGLRLIYGIGFGLMIFTSSSNQQRYVFVLCSCLTLGSEVLLQKLIVELVVGTSPEASAATVLGVMEGAGAALASAGAAAGSRLAGVGSQRAFQVLFGVVSAHWMFELICFYSIARKLFGKAPASLGLKSLAWPLLQFQQRSGLLDALAVMQSAANTCTNKGVDAQVQKTKKVD